MKCFPLVGKEYCMRGHGYWQDLVGLTSMHSIYLVKWEDSFAVLMCERTGSNCLHLYVKWHVTISSPFGVLREGVTRCTNRWPHHYAGNLNTHMGRASVTWMGMIWRNIPMMIYSKWSSVIRQLFWSQFVHNKYNVWLYAHSTKTL